MKLSRHWTIRSLGYLSIIAAIGCLSLPATARAQGFSITATGQVTCKETGLPAAGVTVRFLDEYFGEMQLVTDENGMYTLVEEGLTINPDCLVWIPTQDGIEAGPVCPLPIPPARLVTPDIWQFGDYFPGIIDDREPEEVIFLNKCSSVTCSGIPLTPDIIPGCFDPVPDGTEICWPDVDFEVPCPEVEICEPVLRPHPRSNGYWKATCRYGGGHHAEILESEICAELTPTPKRDRCQKAEAQLAALSLNIAAGKVAECNCVDFSRRKDHDGDSDSDSDGDSDSDSDSDSDGRSRSATPPTTVGDIIDKIDQLVAEGRNRSCRTAEQLANKLNRGRGLTRCR